MAKTKETARKSKVGTPLKTKRQETEKESEKPVVIRKDQHSHSNECELDTDTHADRAREVLQMNRSVIRGLYAKNAKDDEKVVLYDPAWKPVDVRFINFNDIKNDYKGHVWTFEKQVFPCKCKKIFVRFHQTDLEKYSIRYDHCGHDEEPVNKKAKKME